MNAGVLLWASRELRRRWAAVVLLAALIAIGGGAAVAAAAAAHRTETAYGRMLAATNDGNVTVTTHDLETPFELDPTLLDQVMRIDGVIGVAEFASMAVAPEGFPNFFAYAIIDRRGAAMRPLSLEGVRAEQVKGLGADEVLLNEAMSNALGQRTGGTIRLQSQALKQGSAAGPAMTVRIAGVTRGPEDVSDAPDPFLGLPPAFYDKYHGSIVSCRCDVMITATPKAVKSVVAALGSIYPGADIRPVEAFGSRIADTVALQRRSWLLIALAAAVAGAVALFQASTRVGRTVSAGDDARRALGMTRRERRLGRLLVLIPAVVIGTATAAGFVYLLSPLSPVGLTRLAEPSPGLRWDSSVAIPGIAFVLVVSLVVTAIAAVSVRSEMHRFGTRSLGGPELAFGNRLAFGPGRGAIVGVLLATAGLVGALTLERSLNHVLTTPGLYGADFDASNFLDNSVDKRALGDKLVPDHDIAAVGLVWGYAGRTLHIVSPHGKADVDANAYESLKGTLSIRQTTGREPVRSDEVAVGRAVMDELGVAIGDHITAEGTNGTVELTIVGDNLDPGVDVAGHGFATTVEGLSALGEASVQGTVVRFAPHTDHAAIIKRYAALNLTPVTPPSEVGHIGQLGGLPGRVGQLLTLLGIAALLNAIMLTVRLGRREVALHRALGFTNAQVIAVHLWQSVVTALLGIAIGGGVGFVVGRAIDRQLVGNVGAIAETIVPGAAWVVVVGTVAVCLGAGVITSMFALRHRSGLELRTE